ncbi:MAG: hypothetical protein ACTHN5_00545 [Phycisphaerae bacterium]
MPRSQWTPLQGLKDYSRVLARKMGFIALGWLLVFFISKPFRYEGDLNVLMLFAPMIGALAGLVAGWYMATDAVEDSGLTGLPLWTLLVIATCIPIWGVEGIMHLLLPKWPFGFGGWMLLSAATLIALATCVWHSSSQE